jgi:hypothetical protein
LNREAILSLMKLLAKISQSMSTHGGNALASDEPVAGRSSGDRHAAGKMDFGLAICRMTG